jgi:prolyl oligopeptidase
MLLALLLVAAVDYPRAPSIEDAADPFIPLETLDAAPTRDWLAAQARLLAREVDHEPALETYERRIRQIQDQTAYWTALPAAGNRFVLVGSRGATGGSGPAVTLFLREGSEAPRPLLTGATAGGALSRWVAVDRPGRRLAYLVGEPGSRWLRLRVLDLDRSATIDDDIVGLHSTAPQVAWLPDGSGIVYAHFDPPADPSLDEIPAPSLRLHRLGTPQSTDEVLLAPDPAWQSWLTPKVMSDGRLVVEGARGTSGRSDLWIEDMRVRPIRLRPLMLDAPGSPRVLGSDGRDLIVERGGRIVAVDTRRPGRMRERIPASADALVFAAVGGGRVMVVRSRDARPLLSVHALDGRWQRDVALPEGRNIWGPPWGFGIAGPETGHHVWFNSAGLADPGTLYRLDTVSGALERWQPAEVAADPDLVVTRHVLISSADGTRFPMFLCHARGTVPDARRPIILYAYGALSWSAFPWFQPQMVAFLERGGVFAVAGVRGGGEYGEAWHRAGQGRNRQRAVADVHAAADWLVHEGWTTPDRLAAQGSSLGTALMALAVLEKPRAFGAVLLDIPVLDLLRYGLFTGGKLWAGEIGWSGTPDGAAAMRPLSPYHRFAGGCHPPTLFWPGSRDETAVPLHAYKYVAALQSTQDCPSPVLLQVMEGAGHSMGANPEQAARSWARQLAFLELVLRPTR